MGGNSLFAFVSYKLVHVVVQLGMSSAVATLCGASIWCKSIQHARRVSSEVLDCPIHMLAFPCPCVLFDRSDIESLLKPKK